MAVQRTFFRAVARSSPQVCSRTSTVHVRASSSSTSTSALAYKALHRRISPLPTAPSPSWSAPAAVSSILYETPLPSSVPPKRHILNCLVQNEPGVLSRVSGILAARGFNIDSLVDGVVEQARRQLEDLVPVWAVLDYTNAPLVQRELLLAKVSILGPEFFEELLAHHREISAADPGEVRGGSGEFYGEEGENGDGSTAEDATEQSKPKEEESLEMVQERMVLERESMYHPRHLAASQALRHKHEHLDHITRMTHQFGGKVLDISTNNCIVELSAKPARIDSFMALIAPFGILESSRTGLTALPRTPIRSPIEELEKDVEDVVDASTLPPG